METITFNLFSQTSYLVEPLSNGISMANGTCFFVIRNNKTYLITNWHIVTGKNPNDNKYLGYYAVSPEQLKVNVYKNQDILETTDLIIELYDENKNQKWLEHPSFANKVDVIALEVEIPNDKLVISPENFIEPFNENTNEKVSNDVFILGFPFGLKTGNIFPIWKRGSLASEPIVDLDNIPKMYVDTASRSGMSGSPVIYLEKRSFGIGDGPPNDPNANFSSNFTKMIGIYSGRIGASDELNAQLGIVWKYRVIDEIIKGE